MTLRKTKPEPFATRRLRSQDSILTRFRRSYLKFRKIAITFVTCLSDAKIIKYAGGKKIYYWHISDLKIYDEPKELGDFHHCGENYHFNPAVTKPSQSWCYVEETS